MFCSWTAAFSPSLSRGPSFPEYFRFYFWGQQTGKQKWEILPWQVVHTPRWFQLNRPGRSNLKLLSESNACLYGRHGEARTGGPHGCSQPARALAHANPAGGGGSAGTGPEKEVGTRPRRSRSSPAPRLRRLTWPRGTTTDTLAGNGKLERKK